MWESEFINLGKVKERKTKEFNFKYIGQQELVIKSIEKSCGCTDVKYDKDSKFLKVSYKAGRIPIQLKGKDSMVTNKRVKLYTNLGEFLLKFKATIVK